MGLLKELDYHLADFLEANQHISHMCCSLHEEFSCCCDRARHAIKEFTNQGDDGKVSDCFSVAGDALCDLQWCLRKIPDFRHQCIKGYGDKIEIQLRFLAIERALFPLWWALKVRKTFINDKGPSACSDARNGRGSAHLPPGLNLDDLGEIELSSLLGEGSQGTVYKAMWSSSSGTSELGRGGVYAPWHELVAVKEVSSETRSEGLEALELAVVRSGGDSVSRSNLYCELDVLKTLNHPNIVELKGYTRKVKAEGKYGLVMELMSCSLGDLIESEKLSDLTKVDTLLQVARGMHFLHTVGIMHRDLKPANILIRELNYLPPNARCLSYVVAKLADFGLSKRLSKQEDLAVDGAGLHTYKQGTHFYMAPEVRKSCNDAWESRYAMSADVFGFGTTCFNVLTGEETPFVRKGHPLKSEEFYRRIEEGNLDELFDNVEYGRSKMVALVRQCWCLDPSNRPNFLKICQILEDEKRQILCHSTPTSSPPMLINKVGPSVYTSDPLDPSRDSLLRNRLDYYLFLFWRLVETCKPKIPSINWHFFPQRDRNIFDQIVPSDELVYLHELGKEHSMLEKGQVHIAMWRGVHPVALKKVLSANFYANFKMLNHPNVVELKGYTWEAEENKYAVVELMKCSLLDLMKVMPMSELVSVDVLLQVARGMEFLHAKGIIHRDLKPANILIGWPHQNGTCLDEYLVAKISDFWDDSRENSLQPKKSENVFSFGTICLRVLTGEEFDSTRYPRQTCGASSQMTLLVSKCLWGIPPPFFKICRILEKEKRRILGLKDECWCYSMKQTFYPPFEHSMLCKS